jgi:hypothetical protein
MRAKGIKSPAWGTMQVKRITDRVWLVKDAAAMGSRKIKK